MTMVWRYACTFAPRGWSAADWILVGSPRWAWRGAWVQEADHRRDQVPSGASEVERMTAQSEAHLREVAG